MTDTAWVALSLVERVGSKTLRALLEHFNHDPRAVLSADSAALQQVPGIGAKMAERIRAINLEQVEGAIARWEAAGIQVAAFHDPDYPASLRTVDDAPPTLFARGLWPPPNGRRAAVVGTREPSPEARALAQNLASALVELGYTIVSGLAVGIDQSAHLGALAIPGGYTLGVLGCGVLNIYPPGNIPLAQAVMSHGAVLSEFNPFATPSASNLVARNRVITGLSDAVIVVETDVNGGAMHAARFAAVQGRPVYTFDSAATGNRALLQSGAVALKPDLSDLPF